VIEDTLRIRLRDNWRRLLDEVAEAAISAGRQPDEVRVIGVSKYVDVDVTMALRDVGCIDLGEARPQKLIEKASAFNIGTVSWHLIGALQRNKAKRTVEVADFIHSVDSIKLLQTILSHASQCGRFPKLLIEVNISGDGEKHGFTPSELLSVWDEITTLGQSSIVGLMAMAGLTAQGDEVRQQFSAVRELRETLQERYRVTLPELSMGMSGDFRQAIGEGATMVRVGSRLFEGVTISQPA
jgi:pyridoxal phosphate enzyme (YggS family)